MVKRMIRFPLKMKNGAEVRSLEELRSNADVESVMQYYFSGQLSRWCRAFNINELPEKITENNEMFVKKVLEVIGIELSEAEIKDYVDRKFGNSTEAKEKTDTCEVKIIDNSKIKEKLHEIIGEDEEINLDNYQIESEPVADGTGTVIKYRVRIDNKSSDQYFRFSIPYELDNEYTSELFEKDLYNNIKYALENAEKSIEFFNHKTGYYKSFNVGDTFNFGRYYGKPIKWKILRKSNDSMYIISAEELCSKQFYSNCNNRSSIFKFSNCSGIIKWLNEEFYSNAFTEYEKEEIGTIGSYKVGLLTKEDAESLMTQQERAIGSCWWLWSSYGWGTDFWCVISDGTFRHQDGSYESGIRPTLNLKF